MDNKPSTNDKYTTAVIAFRISNKQNKIYTYTKFTKKILDLYTYLMKGYNYEQSPNDTLIDDRDDSGPIDYFTYARKYKAEIITLLNTIDKVPDVGEGAADVVVGVGATSMGHAGMGEVAVEGADGMGAAGEGAAVEGEVVPVEGEGAVRNKGFFSKYWPFGKSTKKNNPSKTNVGQYKLLTRRLQNWANARAKSRTETLTETLAKKTKTENAKTQRNAAHLEKSEREALIQVEKERLATQKKARAKNKAATAKQEKERQAKETKEAKAERDRVKTEQKAAQKAAQAVAQAVAKTRAAEAHLETALNRGTNLAMKVNAIGEQLGRPRGNNKSYTTANAENAENTENALNALLAEQRQGLNSRPAAPPHSKKAAPPPIAENAYEIAEPSGPLGHPINVEGINSAPHNFAKQGLNLQAANTLPEAVVANRSANVSNLLAPAPRSNEARTHVAENSEYSLDFGAAGAGPEAGIYGTASNPNSNPNFDNENMTPDDLNMTPADLNSILRTQRPSNRAATPPNIIQEIANLVSTPQNFIEQRVAAAKKRHAQAKVAAEIIEEQQSGDFTWFHFTEWPDHGVPEPPATTFNNFVILLYNSITIDPTPTFIHCSAGVGRTGTLYVILKLLFDNKDKIMPCSTGAKLKYKKEDEMESTCADPPQSVQGTITTNMIDDEILKAREDRCSFMVQTYEQYYFIYIYFGHFNKVPPPLLLLPPPPKDPQFESLKALAKKIITKLGETKLTDEEKNLSRYKDPGILPYRNSMAKLATIPTNPTNPTNYINANYLEPFNVNDNNNCIVIAGQCPQENGLLDLYRMISANNIQRIINVTGWVEKGISKCYEYLPLDDNESMNITSANSPIKFKITKEEETPASETENCGCDRSTYSYQQLP